jgi:large subunit ribosomal protein L4
MAGLDFCLLEYCGMEMTLPVYDMSGQQLDSIQLNEDWVELEKGDQAVKDCVVAYLAAKRSGTAATKTRAAKRGGGAKPYRQKGTGRARAGSTRSPIWRGGGVAFGPIPRSYRKKINKKVKRLAIKRAFSAKVEDQAVKVVDSLDLDSPKTKGFARVMENLSIDKGALVICGSDVTNNTCLASRNLADVELMSADNVNPYWLLRFDNVVFTRSGFNEFVNRFEAVTEE